jgi:exosome complex exonuclease DIS3/RRP44
MAQMAGRASVEFYVGLALKARGEQLQVKAAGETDQPVQVKEEAFVIRTFRNGFGVFVFKLGIEGLVQFKQDGTYDADNFVLTLPDCAGEAFAGKKIAIFDKVTVGIYVEKDRNTQRGRVKMALAASRGQ